MEVIIESKIDYGQETPEKIRQVVDASIVEKNGKYYFTYQNEEDDRVIIKVDHSSLKMTRFSQPKSDLTFVKEGQGQASVPTPMGNQSFITDTQYFDFSWDEGQIDLHYHLRDSQSMQSLAFYQLSLKW